MNIQINLEACQTPSGTRGIGRYSQNLASALLDLAEQETITISADPAEKKSFNRLQRCLGTTLLSTKEKQRHTPSVYHYSSNFEWSLPVPRVMKSSECISSCTLYDLIPFIFPQGYLMGVNQFAKDYYQRIANLKTFDVLLAISESARQDAISYLGTAPDRVFNISGACDDFFRQRGKGSYTTKAIPRKLGISKPFWMYTTSNDYRKNNTNAIRAFAMLPPALQKQYQLVLISSHFDKNLVAGFKLFVTALGLPRESVVFLTGVSDATLRELYRACYCFIFPSLYEGLGLPILEAMACGAPVITSNTSSMPELVHRKDALFDPREPAAIADKMRHVATNKNFRNKLAEYCLRRGNDFTWEKSAIKAFEAWRSVAEGVTRKRRR